SDTLAAALKEEPDWNALPKAVPAGIRKLLRRCLAKERRERLQAIGDARIEIAACLSAPADTTQAEAIGLESSNIGRRLQGLSWISGFVPITFLIAAIVSTVSYMRLARPRPPAIIAEIPPPEKTEFNTAPDPSGPPVLSPDGHTLAFSAVDMSGKTKLWIR